MHATTRQFYECGICGCYHAIEWNGDCREDAARHAPDELDAKYGGMGWECVEMPTWDSAES